MKSVTPISPLRGHKCPQQGAFRAHDADCVVRNLDALGEGPDGFPPIAALSEPKPGAGFGGHECRLRISMPELTFHEVDEARWPDFERFFESRGGPKSCWCMVWRARGVEAKQTKGPQRKQAMKGRVRAGVPIGLLGYLDGAPAAWCSIAPRSTHRPLGGPTLPGETDDGIWSLVCFFVKRELRGQGMSVQLIEAAVAHARARGARIVEAYPVKPGSPSYRFMGYVPAFEQAGFQHVGTAGSRRNVMRLWLDRHTA